MALALDFLAFWVIFSPRLAQPRTNSFARQRQTDTTRLNTARLSPKKHSEVGWVEERNPTFSGLCWVSLRSTQPTNLLNRAVLLPDLLAGWELVVSKIWPPVFE